MNQIWSTLGVLALVILVGALFVAAEMALVSLRAGQIKRMVDSNRRGAAAIVRLNSDPNRFLAAAQVGVTLMSIVSGAFGAERLVPIIEPWFADHGIPAAKPLAFIVITLVTGYLTLVFGELVPKRFALQRAEKVALFLAGPLDGIARIFRPFVWMLSRSTDVFVKLLGGDPGASREAISGEELRGLVATHEELTVEERDLIDDVFESSDKELREVMIPRTEVAFLDAEMPLFKAAKSVADLPHSRYPVSRDTTDDIVGFVHVRDILDPDMAERSIRVGEIARPIRRYPGTKLVIPTLTDMRRNNAHMALVVDEYNGTAGIITLEDLVEELIGDIRDEYDTDEGEESTVAGVAVVDGLMNIEDLAADHGVEVPDGPYETVAGFMVARIGRLPEIGDVVNENGATFEVIDLDGRRISRVRVTSEPLQN